MTTAGMQRMLTGIERETAMTVHYTGIGQIDPAVMDAIASVPREQFVPPDLRAHAYDNRPLPIGHDQTISQPYIVALMTHLLKPGPGQRILEVGTGSGYQAAILSRLAGQVYSIERVATLSEATARTLAQLGIHNVELSVGNGYLGWEAHAPYDGIIVTAAANEVPPALLQQLAAGGRLVIPVGPPYGHQELMLIEKEADGSVSSRSILPVAFVPLFDNGPETAASAD